jgi:hypothetical protein
MIPVELDDEIRARTDCGVIVSGIVVGRDGERLRVLINQSTGAIAEVRVTQVITVCPGFFSTESDR